VLWDRLRAVVLAEEPCCRPCLKADRVTLSTQVDHVKPIAEGGAPFERSNLQGICISCHSTKTALELSRRGVWGSKI
jgi:5-methylcytosine-specific restriction endonuclease McrA